MKKLPLARAENLVVQELEHEVLVYDLSTDKAFCLNATLSIVYQFCNGKKTFAELKTAHPNLNDDLINFSLDELGRENLLEDSSSHKSAFEGVTRREVIRKIALSTLVAIPVITAIVAPSAVQAQSQTCTVGQACVCAGPINADRSCGSGIQYENTAPCKSGCTCISYVTPAECPSGFICAAICQLN